MINKVLIILSIITSTALYYNTNQYVDTTGSVVIAGSIVSSKHNVDTKKHKRKDCPVCKGKGWYISGDGISRVDCGYCEPDSSSIDIKESKHANRK